MPDPRGGQNSVSPTQSEDIRRKPPQFARATDRKSRPFEPARSRSLKIDYDPFEKLILNFGLCGITLRLYSDLSQFLLFRARFSDSIN